MKNYHSLAALLAAFLLLAACEEGNPALKRLNGEWHIDVEATLALDKFLQDLPPQEREESMEISRGLLAGMALIIDARKSTLTTSIGAFKETVTVSVRPGAGDKLILIGDVEEFEIALPDEDTMLAVQGGSTLIVFKRQ